MLDDSVVRIDELARFIFDRGEQCDMSATGIRCALETQDLIIIQEHTLSDDVGFYRWVVREL